MEENTRFSLGNRKTALEKAKSKETMKNIEKKQKK
jgi:hypothetical protein